MGFHATPTRTGCVLLLSSALATAIGCSATPKGSLMLAISTDMQTPKDISLVSVFVAEGSDVKFAYVGRVLPDGTVALPSTLAVVEGDDPNTELEIRVIGFNGQAARVLRDVRTTVPHARTALLRLPLDFIDDGSATGTLPEGDVPALSDAGPSQSVSGFDPTVITSTCDPMGQRRQRGQVLQRGRRGRRGPELRMDRHDDRRLQRQRQRVDRLHHRERQPRDRRLHDRLRRPRRRLLGPADLYEQPAPGRRARMHVQDEQRGDVHGRLEPRVRVRLRVQRQRFGRRRAVERRG
jgi:hypothetical protein